jgi:hypothetical protein
MNEEEVVSQVASNRVGWLALRHREGWWVGTEGGTTCYKDRQIARAALTILWQRDDGRRIPQFRIETFTGAEVNIGDWTPKKSAEQALSDYE